MQDMQGFQVHKKGLASKMEGLLMINGDDPNVKCRHYYACC